MNAFVLTSPLAGVMLLTRRQPFYPSAAHDKFFSICTAFGGYTKFGIAPIHDYRQAYRLVFEYIEAFYNTKRIHSHCDFMSPNDFELLYEQTQTNKLLLVS